MQTILYIDHTAKIGGGEIALVNLIRGLDRMRFNPVVALASDGPLVGRLRDCGIQTLVIPLDASVVETRKDTLGFASILKLRQIAGILLYARRLASFARQIDARIIHTNSLKSDVYGGLAGRMAGIPVVWHVRDSINAEYLPKSVATVFRLLAGVIPNLVITNSESTLRYLRLPRRQSAGVVYSGVDLALNNRAGSEAGRDQNCEMKTETSTIALVGRIAPWKGQDVFIQAAATVIRKYPKCRFQIIGAPLFGEDEYLDSLHLLADRIGVGHCVEFLGFRNDVGSLVDAADIVVHASVLGEPFGQVVVEAMAAGKPVVATNGGALPEIVIHNETGYLVPMGSASAMADAMTALLADPIRALEMGRAGRERVRERFTIEHSIDKLQTLYSRLLRSERKGSGIPEPVPST